MRILLPQHHVEFLQIVKTGKTGGGSSINSLIGVPQALRALVWIGVSVRATRLSLMESSTPFKWRRLSHLPRQEFSSAPR
jgi:hypothetical protein